DYIVNTLAFIKGLKAPFEYVEIGKGWQNSFGDWDTAEGININAIAAQINKSGYKAGIWTAPFLVEKNSEFLEANKQWVLRHADGSACTYVAEDTEYFVLDISSEECLEYITMIYQRLSASGYYMHNVDHTRAFILQKDVVLFAGGKGDREKDQG
ncbi:MAG: alpha-galactosidase, partial [Clostridia bacterium]|nr:alpha-galactosidase [Clostridia bacterium]